MLLLNQGNVSNWSESVQFSPKEIVYPKSVEEIQDLVQQANKTNSKIRVVGSAHSFTPIMESKDILLSLDELQGLIHVDEENSTVEVWAGTKLNLLSDLLFQKGFALENMGDINLQSVAGALLTGTHGTGAGFGILATQIKELTFITGNSDMLTSSPTENGHIFKALSISLGMLGIVVKMKLRIVKATPFQLKSIKVPLEEVLSSLDRLKENKHFEFFFFPYGDNAQVKMMNETNQTPTSLKWEKMKMNFIENNVFLGLSEICRLFPSTTNPISRLSSNLVSVFEMVGYSHELFATERNVKFNEMEYSIPADKMEEVIHKIREIIKDKQFHVHFPIECRFVKGDDLWLSPAYQRDSAYIALHMYKGMPYKDYFREIEAIFQDADGRPHWGKMHNLTYAPLQKLYPKLHEFKELRATLDPNNIFMNDYLQKLFGI